MKDNFELNHKQVQPASADGVSVRKPYHRPELQALGDLRTMTLGTSLTGMKDSGVGTLWEYAGDLPIPNFPPPDDFQDPTDPYYIPPL